MCTHWSTPWSAPDAMSSVALSHRNRLIHWLDAVEWFRVYPVALKEVWRMVDGPLGCFCRVEGDLDPTVASFIPTSQNQLGFGEWPWVTGGGGSDLIGVSSKLERRLPLVTFADYSRRHGLVKRDGCPLSAGRVSVQHDLRWLFGHRKDRTGILSSNRGSRLTSGFFCLFLEIVLHCTLKCVHRWVVLFCRFGLPDTLSVYSPFGFSKRAFLVLVAPLTTRIWMIPK